MNYYRLTTETKNTIYGTDFDDFDYLMRRYANELRMVARGYYDELGGVRITVTETHKVNGKWHTRVIAKTDMLED